MQSENHATPTNSPSLNQPSNRTSPLWRGALVPDGGNQVNKKHVSQHPWLHTDKTFRQLSRQYFGYSDVHSSSKTNEWLGLFFFFPLFNYAHSHQVIWCVIKTNSFIKADIFLFGSFDKFQRAHWQLQFKIVLNSGLPLISWNQLQTFFYKFHLKFRLAWLFPDHITKTAQLTFNVINKRHFWRGLQLTFTENKQMCTNFHQETSNFAFYLTFQVSGKEQRTLILEWYRQR